MCGGTSSTLPDLPNRHQIRSAMRKVARVMRRNNQSLSLNQFMYNVLVAGGWDWRQQITYERTQDAILKSLEVSTFFNREEITSHCSSYVTLYLTVRKSAIL